MMNKMLTMTAIAALAATTALAQSSSTSGTNDRDRSGQSGQTGGHMSGQGGHMAGHGGMMGDASKSTRGSSKLPPADRRFVMEAAGGGLAEVELGQLATSKGSSAEVRSFGQMMVDDHTKANDELKTLAASKGVTVPSDLDAAHKAKKARLEKLSGDEFDKAYMKEMLLDHKKDVADFKRAAQSGQDSEIKDWASKTLPALEKHLDHAQQTASAVGASGSAGTSATGTSTHTKSKSKPKSSTDSGSRY